MLSYKGNLIEYTVQQILQKHDDEGTVGETS